MNKKHSIGVYISLAIIWLYKKIISPVIHLIPGSGCRFTPTCSQYTAQALKAHGFIKGSIMGFFRILRCNPFCQGGIDNVPQKFTLKGLFEKNAK
ncbi:MAG: membrane protein insertion efficiency factor YidD [Opitutales bacterium]